MKGDNLTYPALGVSSKTGGGSVVVISSMGLLPSCVGDFAFCRVVLC